VIQDGRGQVGVDCVDLFRIRAEDQEDSGCAFAGGVDRPGAARVDRLVDELEERSDVEWRVWFRSFHPASRGRFGVYLSFFATVE
jgi:hypothetical protein